MLDASWPVCPIAERDRIETWTFPPFVSSRVSCCSYPSLLRRGVWDARETDDCFGRKLRFPCSRRSCELLRDDTRSGQLCQTALETGTMYVTIQAAEANALHVSIFRIFFSHQNFFGTSSKKTLSGLSELVPHLLSRNHLLLFLSTFLLYSRVT